MYAHVLRFCSKAVATKNNFVLYRENAKAIERRFQGLKVEKLGRVMSLLRYMCQIVDRDILGVMLGLGRALSALTVDIERRSFRVMRVIRKFVFEISFHRDGTRHCSLTDCSLQMYA